jgi:antitoxin ParD1/3/4
MQVDDLRLDLLRVQLKAGVDALDRGDFIAVDDADREAALDRPAAPDAR